MVVADMFSVMLPQLGTIGRMLGGFLWIFFSGNRVWKFYECLVGYRIRTMYFGEILFL